MEWITLLAPAIDALIQLGIKLAAERGISESDARAALIAEMVSGASDGDIDIAAVKAVLDKARKDALIPTAGEPPAAPNPVQLGAPLPTDEGP